MSFDAQRLYELLPAVYRVRDSDGALRGLIEVIAEQVAVLEENLSQLYDDQFIETCADWVVAYIGDLVGARGIVDLPGAAFSPRAQVANTLAYRRRKGTAAMLEQLARDMMNRDAAAVEFFLRLATTQHMNHIRLDNLVFPDIRGHKFDPAYLLTPFDMRPRTAEMRRIVSGRGKYNIPNVGIFIWRLRAYPVTEAPAFRVDDRRYMFGVLGADVPLFNDPQTEDTITHLAESLNVPTRIFCRSPEVNYYGAGKSISIQVDGVAVPEDQITFCNLSDTDPSGTTWAHSFSDQFGVDPERGRLTLPGDLAVSAETQVTVTYHYGFSDDIGGGEYDRDQYIAGTASVTVSGGTGLDAALAAVQAGGIVEILDSAVYDLGAPPTLTADPNAVIEIRAADGRRPLIRLGGEWQFSGSGAEITLSGLLIEGAPLRVAAGVGTLRLMDCTLVPGLRLNRDGTPATPASPSLFFDGDHLVVERSITGGLRVDDDADASLTRSIIDATSDTQFAYVQADGGAGGKLSALNCTLIGAVFAKEIGTVTNTIFLARSPAEGIAPVRAARRQSGCVRYSYVSDGAQLPRRYRCQPDDPARAALVRPQLTSDRYGSPGYCQLSRACAVEIREGAEDGSEMGVCHDLFLAQRERNLRIQLDEFLRFGLEAGIFYVS